MLIANLVIGMSANTSRLQKGMTRSQRLVQGLVRGLGALAILQGFSRLVRSNEEFNQAMRRSLAIMSDVNAKIRKDMERTARDVAFNTKFSATQAAESYFFLASAGLSAEQSLAALPKVALFAQAGNFDMALATDLLTDAQSALGLTVDDTAQNMRNMTRVSDVLADANQNANATIQQFSEALTQKAGVALRNLGKEIEEGIAILSVYADQGLKGAEAGTALNIVMRDLTMSAVNNAEAFKTARVAVFDSMGEMRNMSDIVEDLENALAGASDQQKVMTLSALGFPSKSQAFIKSLLGSSDALREYEANALRAAGRTEEIADSMLTPWERASNKLAAAFASITDVALTPLIELVAEGVEGLAELLKSFADVAQGVNEASENIKTFLRLTGPGMALTGLGIIGDMFSSSTADDAAASVAALAEETKKLAINTELVNAATAAYNKSLEKQDETTLNIITGLRKTRDEFGMTARQLAVNNALFNEGTLGQIEMINGLHDQIDAMKLAEDQMKENEKRIKEQAKAALDFRKTFNRAFRGLSVGAVERGSADAHSVLTQMRRTAMQVPTGRDTGRETVAKLGDIEAAIRVTNKKLDALPQPAAF